MATLAMTHQATATASQPATNDGWTLVTRRRRPPHFNPSTHSPPKHTTVLNSHYPTYTQVLKSNLKSPQTKQITPQEKTNRYIRSPQSPTNLRYSPNPNYKEWWGQCFRCARKGHIVAECKFPRTIGSAHVGGGSTQEMSTKVPTNVPPPPYPPPVQHQPPTMRRNRPEPSFEEFFAHPEPQEEPQMPSIRPNKVQCFFNRDESYYNTLDKMMSGLVLLPSDGIKAHMSLDQAAAIIVASTKVSPNQL